MPSFLPAFLSLCHALCIDFYVTRLERASKLWHTSLCSETVRTSCPRMTKRRAVMKRDTVIAFPGACCGGYAQPKHKLETVHCLQRAEFMWDS